MIDQALLTDIQQHAGCPCPPEALELVWKESEKVAKQSGTPLEFVLAEQVKALWASANQQRFNHSGKPVDFTAFCRERLSKTDGLWSKLLGRKSKAAQSVADVEQLEAEITAAKSGLNAAQSKAAELANDIATTEAELEANSDAAVEHSVNEAAKVWHMRNRSPHHESKISGAVAHAVEQEVVGRILSARLIYLRDLLATEQAKVESFTSELKRLEKSL
jgi:hypothetical protein